MCWASFEVKLGQIVSHCWKVLWAICGHIDWSNISQLTSSSFVWDKNRKNATLISKIHVFPSNSHMFFVESPWCLDVFSPFCCGLNHCFEPFEPFEPCGWKGPRPTLFVQDLWDCHNRIYRNIICTDNNMDGKLRNELIWNYITIKEEFNLENWTIGYGSYIFECVYNYIYITVRYEV